MDIKIEKPPIWDKACEAFEVSDRAVFTYGNTLYNPANGFIDEHLMRHEETHAQQQAITSPDEWWQRYINDPKFRMQQELEAYHNQYTSYCRKNKDRNAQTNFLVRLARDLSSPLYKLDVSMHRAMQLIRSFE